MKLEALWGGIGAATAFLAATGLAALFRLYGNDKTEIQLEDIAPDPKRFPQYIQTKQGHWLSWKRWTVPEPKAVVFLAHGIAEHCGRYEHVAQALTKQNIKVFALDHQGHGQSTGTLTYFERFHHIVDDYKFFVNTMISRMGEHERKLPRFLFGHSMGGAIAIHFALTSQDTFQGVILSAPMVSPDPSVATPSKVKMAKMLSDYLPKIPIGSLDLNTICSDSAVVRQTSFDRLYSKASISARVASEFLAEMDYLQSVAADVTFPYYLFYGSDDKITSVEGIALWNNNTKSKEKTSTVFPGLFHESLNEQNHELVIDSISKWIQDRLGH